MADDLQWQAERGLSFASAPEDLDMTPVFLTGRDLSEFAEGGSCYILSDALFDDTGPTRRYVSRLIQQVTGSDGLHHAASFEVSFNPAYERLIIHSVRVCRDGMLREVAGTVGFELLRRELNLERAMYDGRLTAHALIPDVRVGDIIDTSFSIEGANPALCGTLSVKGRLQWTCPTLETRITVKVLESRPIAVRSTGSLALDQEDDVADGIRTLTWRLADAPTYRHESDVPNWHAGYAGVHVADALTWAEIADVFRPYYALSASLPADLAHLVDELADRFHTARDRTPAALRLVQSSLRYHAVGVGEGGYRPRSIDDIWSSRYGDCKDASLLLVAVLRALGVEASAALVNTIGGHDLPDQLPNTTAFNHCIVKTIVDGQTIFLDPTLSPQAGDLGSLTPVRHFWALPLVARATLEAMPEPEIVDVCETTETWSFDARPDQPARLAVRTVYRDWRADDTRRWIANDSLATVSRRLREGLEQEYGTLTEIQPLTVSDDGNANLLVLEELYDVAMPWRSAEDGKMRFVSRDDVVGPNLRNIETARRTQPLSLGTPRRVFTKRVFHFHQPFDLPPWEVLETGPGASISNSFKWSDDVTAVHYLILTLRKNELTASEALDHFAFMRRARANNGVTFDVPVQDGKIGKAIPSRSWGLYIWLALVVGAVGYAMFLKS